MKKVEIFKYLDKINAQIERTPEVSAIMQSIYNKLNSNVMSVSFESLIEIATKHIFESKQVNGQNQSVYDGHKEISNLLKTLTVDSNPENTKVMGFRLNREKLIDMMEVDENDTKELVSLFQSLSIEDWNMLKYLEFDKKAESVIPVADFKQKIVESLTIYADNERQIKATSALVILIDALNGYANSHTIFVKPEGIDGLKFDTNKNYQLDFERIKQL